MAILKSSLPFGRISGKLGNFVFRIRNNKTFVSKSPGSYMPGTDPASIERRLKFKTTSGFSKTVLKLLHIKEIWKKETKNMSAYNAIFKYSYPKMLVDDLLDSVSFFPDLGVGLICDLILFDEDGFIVKVKPAYPDFPLEAKFIQMGAVLMCKSPVDERDPNIDFEEFNSKPVAASNEMIVKILYNDFMKCKYGDYREFKLFVGFSLLNEEKVFLQHSNTYRVK